MLEIVHDLAPGSPLFFATSRGGQAQFASNIQSLCAAGAKVIVDDVGYPFEAVFQDGIVSQGINAAVGNGCKYFSAAGNAGNLTHGRSGVWEGDFVAAASKPPGIVGTAHSFGGGANSNALTVDPPNGIQLQWSDPLGAATNDYDLYLFNSTLTTVFDVSDNAQTGTQDPREFIDSAVFNDLNNRLVIVRFSGVARYLHLDTMEPSGRLAIATSGRIADHAGAANAIAVAAVDVATAGGGAFTGGAANPVESYSSDGRRRIFFTAAGAAITPGNFLSSGGTLLQKPDLAAADCVSTATPSLPIFCGTSAAAPHAAAIAALVLQAAGGPSSLTQSQLRAVLAANALDIESPGVDRDSGAGIIRADTAVAAVIPAPAPPTITSHPSPQTIAFGQTATLSVGATGSGLNYQWYVGPSSATTNPTGSNSSTFVTPALVSSTKYWVRVSNAGGSANSNTATILVSFTDSTLTPGSSSIKLVHVTELRTRINAARAARGLGAFAYTNPTLTAASSLIKAADIAELRTALAQAYAAAGLTPPAYTDPTLTAGVSIVRAVDVTELRNAVAAIE